MSTKKRLLIQIGVGVVFIALVVLAVYLVLRFAMPDIVDIVAHGDEQQIIDYVRSKGSVRGAIFIALFQIIQIVIIVFPGAPIQIAAGIIYGALVGFLICYAANFAAHFGVFLLADKLGGRVEKLFAADGAESKLKFITESPYPQFMVTMAYLVPLLPNGIIPYVSAKTPITKKQFAAALLIGSGPSIFIFCFAGSKILSGDFVFAIVACLLLLAVTVVLFLLRDKIGAKLFGPKQKAKEKTP